MKVLFLKPFVKQYQALPPNIRKKIDRHIQLLAQDLRHPGVRAKKMTGAGDIWEGRVDDGHRFTFNILGDAIVFRKVGSHDMLRTP